MRFPPGSNDSKPLDSVLIVGCGKWGSVVARRIAREDVPLRVAGVVDTDQWAARKLAVDLWERTGLEVYGDTSVENALDALSLDRVVIATPPAAQAAVFEQVADLKVRVEKPCMITAAGVTAGHQTVFAPEAKLFLSIVRSQQVTHWHSTRTGPDRTGLDKWLDLGVHDIALRSVALGGAPCKIKHVVKHSRNVKRQTRVRFADGTTCVLDELQRTVAYGKDVFWFDKAPDPLGVELAAWAHNRRTISAGRAYTFTQEAIRRSKGTYEAVRPFELVRRITNMAS